jgi:hypothetical protein
MTPQRAAELAAELGLDAPPPPRYDDLPEENPETPNWVRPKFLKALQLVDQIETWAFEKFIPSVCEIDHNIDAHVQGPPELHFAVCIRTDRPPPSNKRIANATKIKPDDTGVDNFYRWLGVEIANQYRGLGARKMGVPLIFRTKGSRFKPWIVPYVGAIVKFDRTPAAGLKMDDMVADVGVMVPAGTHVKPSHVFVPMNPSPVENPED